MTQIPNKQFLINMAVLVLAVAGVWYGLASTGEKEAQTSDATSIRAACENLDDPYVTKEVCYSKEFQKLSRAVGSEIAFQTLFELQKIDPDAFGCHFIAHGIGYGNFEKSPGNWREVFQTINQACTYGAMHGTLEMGIATLPDGLTADILPTICGENPRGDCNHIIGHLTLLETEGNIPDALVLCDSLRPEERQVTHCYSGVFMEEQTAFNLIAHGYADKSWLDWAARTPDIEALCNSYGPETIESVQCWKEFAHAIVVKEDGNPGGVFAFCNRSPSQEAHDECRLHAVGIIAARHQFKFPDVEVICKPKQPEEWFARRCNAQLVASVLSTTPTRAAETIDFCGNLPADFQEECFIMVGNNLKHSAVYGKDERASLCESAPEKFRNACQGGGQVDFNQQYFHEEDEL